MNSMSFDSDERLRDNNAAIIAEILRRDEFDEEEWRLLEAVDFAGIDLEESENAYQVEILQALLSKNENGSMLSEIVKTYSNKLGVLQNMEIKKLKFDDLGKKIGTKREVDLVTMNFSNGTFAFTASIDIYEQHGPENSPSERERANLAFMNQKGVKSVQELLASKAIEVDTDSPIPQFKTVICKEFIPGEMLEYFIFDPEHIEEKLGVGTFSKIAYLTGKCFAEPLKKTGYVVKDSNPLNLIVEVANGNVSVRYCDADLVTNNEREIKMELRLLKNMFGKNSADFQKGFDEVMAI